MTARGKASGEAAGLRVNRAAVLTLWGTVVAERLGFDREEALTLGRAIAGLTAQAKGVALGLFTPTPEEVRERRRRLREGEVLWIAFMGRRILARMTAEGLRALAGDRLVSPRSVERYLAAKFGDALEEVRAAMAELAAAYPPEELAARAFELYLAFRPRVPAGLAGWGKAGLLDLDRIRELAVRARRRFRSGARAASG